MSSLRIYRSTVSPSQATASNAVADSVAQDIHQQKGHGQPLMALPGKEWGTKLGLDSRQVHIHTDGTAIQMSQQLGANAFTVGNDIFFNQNQFDPHSTPGQKLLVHELTHVAQQQKGANQIQKQEADPPAAPEPVDRAAYASMLEEAVAALNIEGPAEVETFAPLLYPIWREVIQNVTWRDEAGTETGGGAYSYALALPGGRSITYQIQLVLDEKDGDSRGGYHTPVGPDESKITIMVRNRSDKAGLTSTLYHESLHMIQWILLNHPDTTSFGDLEDDRARSLVMDNFPHPLAALKGQLGLLAEKVNAQRTGPEAEVITEAQLEQTAAFLLEETNVRAETELFNIFSEREEIGRRHAPQPMRLDSTLAENYIFKYSNVFKEADLTHLDEEGKAIVANIQDMLSRWHGLQIDRRYSPRAYRR